MTNTEDTPYQELVTTLENKINILAKTDLNLEESLKIYEEAVSIFVKCDKRLKDAEGQLLKIRENAEGQLTKEPFDIGTIK